MASTLADAFIRIRASTAVFGPELKRNAGRDAGVAGKAAGSEFAKGMKGAVLTVGASISALFAFNKAKAFIKDMFAEARESAKVTRITAAAIASTGGAAKISAGGIDALANRLSNLVGVDDEVIQSGANVLLRFTKIKNEVGAGNQIFSRATGITLDLAAALGKDMNGSAILVGKALNDPIKGMGALSKAGIQFTADQKKQIKTMVESGNVMGAQKFILAQLETRFRGTAAAAADPAQKAKVQWQNFKEELGLKFLPVVNRVLTFVTGKLPAVTKILGTVGMGFNALKEAFSGEGITTSANSFIGVMERIGVVARKLWDFISGQVIPVIVSMVQWLIKNKLALEIVGLALAGVVLGLVAYRTAMFAAYAITVLKNGVLIVYRTILAGVILMTRGWAAAQLALNGAMFANPIGLVIAALVILVGAIILAWRHSETFRNVVMGAWQGIQAAVSFAWNNVIHPIVVAMVAFWTAVLAPTITWLWQQVFEPAWHGIMAVAQIAWVIIKAIFVAIDWYVRNVVGPVFMFLWNNVIRPVWEAIKLAFKVGWAIIALVFNSIKAYIQTIVAPWLNFLWKLVIEPMWRGIKLAFQVGWALIKFVFDSIKFYIQNVIAPIFNFLWKNVIVPVWNGIRTVVEGVWNFMRDKIFSPMIKLVKDTIPEAFRKAKDAIGVAWDQIKEKAAAPVRFVVNTVYTKGIKGLWDKVAGALGLPKMPEMKLGFATGGIVPGRDRGRDEILAMLRPEEGVAVPGLVRQIGKNRFLAWNAMANRGQRIPGFADGGIVGDGLRTLGSLFGKAKNVVAGGLVTLATPIVNVIKKLIDQIPDGSTQWGAIAKAVPTKFLDAIMAKLRGADASASAITGGPGQWRSMWDWVHTRFPYTTLNSGLRPGDPLYHGKGMAIDIGTPDVTSGGPKAFAVFNAIKTAFKPSILELIYDFARGAAVWNGRDHTFTGALSGPGTHNDHIHWANRPVGAIGGSNVYDIRAGAAQWSGTVAAVLRELGVYSVSNVAAVLASIQQESGGNPRAVQHGYVDINTLSGDLAKGLNQVIGSTFRANAGKYASKGQFDPYANIYASVRYATKRYGSRWASVMAAPGGYDNGGLMPPGWGTFYNGTGKPENVTTHDKMEDVVDLLGRLIKAVDKVGPGVGREINGAASTILTMARQGVQH